MGTINYQEDPHICLFCGFRVGATHNMLTHLLCCCFENVSSSARCPCGKISFYIGEGVRHGEIENLRKHIANRASPGILTDPLTLEEIRDHLWTAIQKEYIGVKP